MKAAEVEKKAVEKERKAKPRRDPLWFTIPLLEKEQVWSTNRCVLSNYFFKFEDRWTDQQTCLPVEMQIYISVIFMGLPDDKHEEKPSFLPLKKRITDRRTDRRTDQRTDRPFYRFARTHLKMELPAPSEECA